MTVNFEALKKARAGRGNGGWKPREGENPIRILPPRSAYLTAWDQMTNLAIPFKMHFFKIEGRPTEVSRCLEEVKQACPACAMWRAHRKSSDPAMVEMVKQIAPSDQYLFNLLDLRNLPAGIQTWAANYTCWDKIMEIASNPGWGNVVDPANGHNFSINMTPGNRSRSGWNSYSIVPDPPATTVMNILEGIENWHAGLDKLEEQITATKEPHEITALLIEMGYPVAGGAAVARAATSSAPRPAAPSPAAGAAPVPVASAAPAPVASAAPIPVASAAPVPVASAAPVPVAVPQATPVAVPAQPAATAATATDGVHYDPGADYQAVVPDDQRPDGAPRCFGDYNPRVHQCRECPVLTDCQMKMLDS